MGTVKLLGVVLALLLWAATAPAEEIPETEASPEAVAPASDGAESAPPSDDWSGQVEGASAPAAPAPSEPEAEAPGADAPMAAGTPDAELPAAAAPAPEAPALGAIGYDSQGRQGRVHVVVLGDTLWDISNAYLGTPWVWPSIWQDNQDIANPHRIFPGDHIWITPNEMRKISAEEAAALLAGQPAAPEPEGFTPPEASPDAPVVRQEQATQLVADREHIGLVSAEDVDAASSVVGAVGPRLMLSESSRLWIGLGEGEAASGDQFTIFRVQEKVYDPETRRLIGYHVNLLGWAEVRETDRETSLAEVMESTGEIERGDRVMPRRQLPAEIAVRPSPGSVDGQVSFLANQRTLVGTLEYVYLNRGELDGLEVGSPLEVYRQGFDAREEVRDETVAVPDRKVAELLVVQTEPEAAVALVRDTEEEIALGDRFRGAQP